MAEVWKRTFGPSQDRVPENPVKKFNWGNDFSVNCWKRSKIADDFARALGNKPVEEEHCCSCTRGGWRCCKCGN